MMISITPEIIARAQPQDCYACAVALGLSESTGLDWHVSEGRARIETLWERKPVWKLPPEVRDFIAALDRGEAVEPISFKLPARFADTERWAVMGAGVMENT